MQSIRKQALSFVSSEHISAVCSQLGGVDEWLTLLLPILEVPVSNLDPENGYPD
jgi:hypothetical protein